MKLLIVCQAVDANHSNLGFFVRWIEEFAKNVESVTVIANEVGEYTLPKNVSVHSLGKEKGASRLSRYIRFYTLLSDLRSEYSHVFVHMNPEFVIAGSPLWRVYGKRVVFWYVHGTVSPRLKLALALSNGACTTDKESLRIESPKVHRVGHGIDTEFFKPGYRLEHDESLLITAGRIAPSKHTDLIVEAVEKVKKELPVRLSIIGGPETRADLTYLEKLEKQIKYLLFVKFLGPKNQAFVRDALASADLFINASTTGSMDKALLEAAASGAIPVSSNVAFKEVLEPHELFVPTLSAGAFAEVISKTLRRPDRAAVAEELRAWVVKNHNLVQCISRVVSVLKNA